MELPPFGWSCMFLVLAFPLVPEYEAQIRAIPCPRGTFGSPDCQGICHCLSGMDYCRWENGRCTDGKCSFGWSNPPMCQTACPYGMFGYNCSLLCHCPDNDVCNSISGLCSSNQCLLGWGGPSCQKLLPVLVKAPDVISSTENQVTLTWPKWISGQTGLGVGDVISHTLQQLDNKTSSWQDVVNLQDSDALKRFTYTVVNLRPNTAYKFRIRLVMDDSGKPLPSVPGPESPRWIVTSCSAPSDPPTNVTAEIIENQHTYIRVSWTPPSLGSMNCNGLARHEIFIACISSCVNLIASEEWPANCSIIQYFHYTNYTINITVRAMNDAGHAGPLSVPFYILLPGEMSTGVIGYSTDVTIVLKSVDQRVIEDIMSITTSETAGITKGTMAIVTTSMTADLNADGTSTDITDRMISHTTEFISTGMTTGLIASPHLENIQSLISATSQSSSMDVTAWQSQEASDIPAGTDTQLNSTLHADSPNLSGLTISLRSEHSILLEFRPMIKYMSGWPCEVNVEDLGNSSRALPLTFHKECLTGGVINITGLLPATQYKITVQIGSSVDALRDYTIVLYTAPPPPPIPPTPVISRISYTSFRVKPVTRKRSADISSQLLVVIEKLKSNKSYFQDTVDSGPTFPFEDSRILGPQYLMLDSTSAQLLNLPFYVAGLINSTGAPIVVGDGQTFEDFSNDALVYRTYSNVPLVPNSSYMVWFVSQNSLDGITRRVASRPAGPVVTLSKSALVGAAAHDPIPTAGPESGGGGLSAAMIILIVLCVLLFFIIFLILLIVLFWRRAKANRLTKVKIVNTPCQHPEPSSVNRNLAVSYLNSFLNTRSAKKDFDAISDADGDYVIPDACFIYESSGSTTSRSCPVPVQKLRDFCSEYLLMDSGCSLDEQFLLLPNCFTDSVNVAMLACNAIHNRSAQVVPYDRNHVKLKHALPQSTTYVNASFVRTIGRRYCIVTQCPTLSTFGHFWQMVWERGTRTVVMLMDSEAPDSLNFDFYWPEVQGRHHVYGSIHVELVNVNTFANYSVHHFKIGEVNAIRERHVFHWQYMSWSKGGVPEHPIPFLSFVKRIREERISDAGYLVHCRTGGGRSGIFIAVDTLLTQGHNTGIVDVMRLVTLLRAERSNLVKSFVQYRFIYECLCEEFDHNPSRYLAERFVLTYEGLETSDTSLKTLTFEHQVMVQLPVYSDSLTRSLVRRKSMLPVASMSDTNAQEDGHLKDLDPYPFQTISAFVKRDMFIASRCPSGYYCDEFWDSITDNHVNCIVMLNKMADLPDAEHLLPQMGRTVNSKHFSVFCASVKASPSNIYVAYNLKVQRRHFQDKVSAHNVRLFEFTKWTCDDEVPEVAAMLELLEQLRKWLNRYSANRPVLLFSACGIGKSRAALLMVLWYVLEQSEKEGILDIFSTSRLIRSYIISSMDHQDHYHFMYLAVRDFLKRNLAYYTLPVESKDQLYPTNRPGWTSPNKRHHASASHMVSGSGQPSSRELPFEADEESPKTIFEGQNRKDPLRRNLYHTDLEEAERESITVTDKGSDQSRMSTDPSKRQIYTPEFAGVEKPAQRHEFRTGFVSPLVDEQPRTHAAPSRQNSDPISRPGASQSKPRQMNSMEYEERYAEVLPQAWSSAAKKPDAKKDQGGKVSTIPHINDSGAAEYATIIKTGKSSSHRMPQRSSDSFQMIGNDKTTAASDMTNSPATH